MKTLQQHLTAYAAYHRDRRNIATHFVGIPMIVVAVSVLLARPVVEFAGVAISPAPLMTALAALYYLRLDLRFGLAMTAALLAALWFSRWAGAQGTLVWLGWGLGLFVAGWVIQFIGHYYEGRKPAFVDDLSGLIIGPLFVMAELAFALGLRKDLEHAIEAVVGPTHIRVPAIATSR